MTKSDVRVPQQGFRDHNNNYVTIGSEVFYSRPSPFDSPDSVECIYCKVIDLTQDGDVTVQWGIGRSRRQVTTKWRFVELCTIKGMSADFIVQDEAVDGDEVETMQYKKNGALGQEIHRILKHAGIETPMILQEDMIPRQESRVEMEKLFTGIMKHMRLNLNDDSLRRTPYRLTKMYMDEIFYGLNYDNFPDCMTIENKMQYDELVTVKDIEVMSMCEHHFMPFVGRACVGYIPKAKVIGLSKINRVVDFFSRRPQVQERLTEQVWKALSFVLDTEDVIVVIDAKHMCVSARGIKDSHSSTSTSKIGGRFIYKPEARAEFMALVRSQ